MSYIYLCVCACMGVGARALACACASVALRIQHAARRHIVICGLSGATILFRHYPMNGTIFEKKSIEHKKCVFIFSATFI